MKVQKILLPIIIAVGALAFLSMFIVKETNQAIVLQFGDPKRIITKPGLNFKIPFIQNVVFLDTRILNLDTPPEEVIASDQKRLIVDAFARFRIVDPLKFYISVGNERVARSRLATIINSRLRNVLGQQELQTLLSKDRTKQMALIQEGVNTEAESFGIKIVDVELKERTFHKQTVMQFIEECRLKGKEKQKNLEQEVLRWRLQLLQLQTKMFL